MAEDGSVIIEIKGDTSDYKKSINEAEKATEDFGDKSAQAIDTIAAALAAAGVAATIDQITQAIKACMAASIEFESAMTGVYKTVDGTDEQLAQISDEIKRMSTEIPATTTEIAAVAEAAGQLGIATEDVLSFSKVMIDLGESTNLSAEQAATSLARFANITGTAAENYERLGSVIVGLGNNFATTEAEITEMATRLASAGTLAGLSESNILALAAAMSSVGINAEAGGTAMTQTLSAIEEAAAKGGDKLQAFAEIAGMSATEFSTLWEKDAVTALQQFISGLQKLDEQGESATLVLDELGLSGVRQGNMIKSLALASEEMASALDLANAEWESNTALATEAGQRYATLESQLQMAQNAFNNVKVAIGDALAPALRELAKLGTDAFTWAAEFIEQNPVLVQAITAVIAALATLIGGVTGLSALQTMMPKIIALFKTFGTVLTAHPAIAVASAVVGLVTALGSLVASTKESTEASREMMDTFKASREEYEALSESIQQQNTDVGAMVGALSSLTGNAKQSATSQKAILSIVEQLNEAVPELGLAYDAEANSLSMTTQEILDAAAAYQQLQQVQADAQRYAQLAMENESIAAEIDMLREKFAALSDSMMDSMEKANIADAIRELTEVSDANAAEMEQLAASVDEYAAAQQEAAGAVSETSEELQKQIDEINSAIASSEELDKVTRSLTNEQKLLSDALEEQAENGALSYDTTLDLIDAGYAAALAIDTETGAITLNKEAYVEIAKAKLEDQERSLGIQQQSLENALKMSDEALMATALAESYLTAAEARAAMEEQIQSYTAQRAAISKLRSEIGSYEGSVKKAASSSVRASKKVTTQAEKDLETYKELLDELDHQRAMDAISEAEYYGKLAEYRDKYLTDDANVDEYRKITEKIHSYTKSLVEDEKQQWEDFFEEYAEDFSELQSKVDGFGSKLASTELFTKETVTVGKKTRELFELTDLQESIDQINAFGNSINALKSRGIGAGLLDEVLAMEPEDATRYANALLSMADEEYASYMALWEEKEAAAQRVAAEVYATEFNALQEEYTGKLPDEMRTAGEEAMSSLEAGLRAEGEAAIQAASEIADQIAAQFRSIDMGAYSSQLKAAVEAETAHVSSSLAVTSNASSEAQTAARNTQTAQLAYASSRSAAGQSKDVVLEINGREFARATIEDIRAVENSIPRIEDD